MVFVCDRHHLAAAALLLLCGALGEIKATTISTPPQASPSTNTPPGTCEFRTINYITDSLPQLCGKSSWSITNLTSATKLKDVEVNSVTENASTDSRTQAASVTASITIPLESTVTGDKTSSTVSAIEEAATDLEGGELNEASFLSFEEWKKQTLEKAGQTNPNIGHKRSGYKKRDGEGIQNNLDSLGDEGEIDLDFGAFGNGNNGEEPSRAAELKEDEAKQDIQDQKDGARQYRSKDAGKTCKERFSYASFDAGATILKTHQGAQNPKAVLIENKDSYMLSQCSAENKFVIIELSEDIWIDTLVLANYEFFSSMIRDFRVSVSDKYPVKMEKWKDIGTYEARNSREIQAFLIENPHIWARYLRIEFLSHYGNEYYCPLSLVRVHGTRMLESWKETESIGEDDDGDDGEDQNAEEQYVPEAVADIVKEEEKLTAELKEAQAAIKELIKTAEGFVADTNSSQLENVNYSLGGIFSEQLSTPWVKTSLIDLFELGPIENMCPAVDVPVVQTASQIIAESIRNLTIGAEPTATLPPTPKRANGIPMEDLSSSFSGTPKSVLNEDLLPIESSSITSADPDATRTISDVQESVSSITVASAANKQSVTVQKNKTTSTSSASSSLPTIQESFFKAVSRRLQLLETNSTLSLSYIEAQSKILREAFSKVEKKQLQKTTTFLDTLNSTVLAELRVFRQQYDEIWQSTVISLESQRAESRREILAISARLNILADEVVFQKRMSIVQSLLLLLCLGLVIFSRVSSAGHLDIPSLQSRARAFGFPASPLGSPSESPEYRRTSMMGRELLGPRHTQHDERPPVYEEDSPPTPVSSYSRSDNALTPPSGGDDFTGSTGNLMVITSEHLEIPSEPRGTRIPQASWQESNKITEASSQSPSPIRTSKQRKAFKRQQPSPPADDSFDESHDHDPSCYSPPREPGFSIARKPLPALPSDE